MFTTDHGPFFALDLARDMIPLIASCEPGGGLFFEETTYCERIQSISANYPVSSPPEPVEQGKARRRTYSQGGTQEKGKR